MGVGVRICVGFFSEKIRAINANIESEEKKNHHRFYVNLAKSEAWGIARGK